MKILGLKPCYVTKSFHISCLHFTKLTDYTPAIICLNIARVQRLYPCYVHKHFPYYSLSQNYSLAISLKTTLPFSSILPNFKDYSLATTIKNLQFTFLLNFCQIPKIIALLFYKNWSACSLTYFYQNSNTIVLVVL